jgi:hypothetical protein
VIFLSVGLPGRFAEWCDAVIGRIASRLGGAVIIKTWPSLADMLGYDGAPSALDELALTLIATSAAHIVMGQDSLTSACGWYSTKRRLVSS